MRPYIVGTQHNLWTRPMLMTLLLAVHIVAAVIWVGGMLFAYVCLRPAVGGIEPASERPKLWVRTFGRFFPIVAVSVVALLVTGYAMLLGPLGGFAAAGVYVHVMHLTGLIMCAIFGHLYFGVWPKFRRAVEAGETELAGKKLATIRMIVAVNLGLGWITVLAGSTGRYWPV